MNNTARFFIAAIGAGLLAALADPSISAKLPPGLSQALAVAIAAFLHKMNDKAPDALPAPEVKP